MKAEKKEQMEKMRAYKKVRKQNNKTTGVSLAILAVGLLFKTLNITILGIDIGYYLLWSGVFVFFVTSMSGLFAAGSLRKQK
ncbi:MULTISPECIES: hypothetical protein [unclassified Methanosarcina]|uniref:hypothetical protein n=1 Tax=unclassified Methanosarcina TaxID=2644672 RepID=UPI0006159753|nr:MULTISPECIES: hypothetical protein [unclassified Methanosarcina]AKB16947.1 hypothetical protein MSWHS_0084 [Methanosarcina sp. WWM596]AKB20352.1 hypothetical protein MSWH1_0081 [Methanosarcina sp. WH1]